MSAKAQAKVALFIAEYVRTGHGTNSAIAAGYAARSAYATASKLLKKPEISAEIQRRKAKVVAKVEQKTAITLERTLLEIARVGLFDPRKMFTPTGEPIPITELDDDTAAAVAGLEVHQEFERDQDGTRRPTGTVRKWKIANKGQALDMLMKHLGGYKKDNEQQSTPLGEAIQAFMGGLHGASSGKIKPVSKK